MRIWIVAALTTVVGCGVGWLLRGQPHETIRVVTLPPKVAPLKSPAPPPKFPDLPKPPLETPQPVADETTPSPSALIGDIPRLPNASGPTGMIVPMTPDVPTKLPVADLNADEALARRTILGIGADIVSSSDAKDATGKIGRTLVAETASADREKLRSALRQALGDRIIISDGGSVGGTSPEIQKAEAALETARKKRDQARIDFLPQAPTLRQIEDDVLAQERAVAEMRKSVARLRLNVLIRPILQ